MSCPQGYASNGQLTACSGHGRCKSLRQAAATTDFIQLFNGSSYTDWDADMIQGCICDSGWHGVNCSLRTCPLGDDPTSSGVDEVQLIDCRCSSYKCQGLFQLLIRGQLTPSLPLNTTEETLAQVVLVIIITIVILIIFVIVIIILIIIFINLFIFLLIFYHNINNN